MAQTRTSQRSRCDAPLEVGQPHRSATTPSCGALWIGGQRLHHGATGIALARRRGLAQPWRTRRSPARARVPARRRRHGRPRLEGPLGLWFRRGAQAELARLDEWLSPGSSTTTFEEVFDSTSALNASASVSIGGKVS